MRWFAIFVRRGSKFAGGKDMIDREAVGSIAVDLHFLIVMLYCNLCLGINNITMLLVC